MTQETAFSIINDLDDLFETIQPEKDSLLDYFNFVANIVAKYDKVDCLVNITMGNGNIIRGICLITDWEPGALVLQSDDGDYPFLHIVYPEDYLEYMEKSMSIFDYEYPDIPEYDDEE